MNYTTRIYIDFEVTYNVENIWRMREVLREEINRLEHLVFDELSGEGMRFHWADILAEEDEEEE